MLSEDLRNLHHGLDRILRERRLTYAAAEALRNELDKVCADARALESQIVPLSARISLLEEAGNVVQLRAKGGGR